MENYGLDLHGEMLLAEYHSQQHLYLQLQDVVTQKLGMQLKKSDIVINSMEFRIKTEDSLAGKLKRIDDATIASMTLEPQLEMNYKDRRIILPKDGGKVLEPIKVLRADIDYNKHLNNANYVRMAMELLPEDFEVRGLRVEYRVAAKMGDRLVPMVFQSEEKVIVSLAIGNEVSTIIEFT